MEIDLAAKDEISNRNALYSLRRIAIGGIPYLLFAIGIVFISTTFFQYVENESVLSIFLTKRDSVISPDQWRGKDWTVSLSDENPLFDKNKRAVVRDNERLLVPFFYIGEQIGIIKIPSIDLSVDAIRGDMEAQFRLGAGHSLHSFLPGQGSNIIFGAHRTTHFRDLEYVTVGDIIEFDTVYGSFVYRIDEIRIINGGDDSIAKPTDEEQLTLYTCYPFVYFGNAPKRYVVISSLIESEIY